MFSIIANLLTVFKTASKYFIFCKMFCIIEK
jgi:hypothetical protein